MTSYWRGVAGGTTLGLCGFTDVVVADYGEGDEWNRARLR